MHTAVKQKESDFDYGQRIADELENKILELGQRSVMAFTTEPVVGATAGAVPAVKGRQENSGSLRSPWRAVDIR